MNYVHKHFLFMIKHLSLLILAGLQYIAVLKITTKMHAYCNQLQLAFEGENRRK